MIFLITPFFDSKFRLSGSRTYLWVRIFKKSHRTVLEVRKEVYESLCEEFYQHVIFEKDIYSLFSSFSLKILPNQPSIRHKPTVDETRMKVKSRQESNGKEKTDSTHFYLFSLRKGQLL